MPFSLNEIFFILTIFAGLTFCGFGYYADRRWNEPGVRAFAAFAIVFGTGAISSSLVALGSDVIFIEGRVTTWAAIFFYFYVLSTVPWFLFSVQHTGHVTRIRKRHLGLLTAPLAVAIPVSLLGQTEFVMEETVWSLLVNVVTVLVVNFFGLLLLFLGSISHIRAAWNYGHISMQRGITLAITPLAPLVTHVIAGNWAVAVGGSGAVGFQFLGNAVAVGAVGIALFHYDTFASTPAVGSIGKRQVTKQMDDCVVVIDHRERVIEFNQTTGETFGVSEGEALGDPLEALLGCDIDTLRASEEVSLHTTEGHRQFDVQVSDISDQHDRWLGFIVTLHDVTRREIREQRLQVLNRILRHNLRNKLTVVKASAEVVTDDDVPESDEELSQQIQDAVDELLALSGRAKNIEQLMHESRQDSVPFSLERAVEEVVEDVRMMHSDVSIETSIASDLVVYADEELFVHILWNVVENATRHNDAENPSVTVNVTVHPDHPHQVRIEVCDNGPGIPDHELEVIRQGHETDLDHASGLGLWATSWGVRYLGGEVTFADNDPRGTVVSIELPSTLFTDEELPNPGQRTGDRVEQD